MSALEPGFYTATVEGVPNIPIMITDEGGSGWTTRKVPDTPYGTYGHGPEDLTDIRPLIVLDLGRSSASNFAQVIREDGYVDLADQVEAQTKPARIPEPSGRGAVVEDGSEYHFPWTRFSGSEQHNDGNWINEDGVIHQWAEITDPTLVAEGVTE